MRRITIVIGTCGMMLARAATASAAPPGTAFTYQGQLKDGGSPANGLYDLQFNLFFDPVTGAPSGTITLEDQQVTNGLFTVALDFGAGIITGDALWLGVSVRPGPSAGAFTPLNPRQKLTPVPYALALALPYSGSAGNTDPLVSLSQFGNGQVLSVGTSGLGIGLFASISNNANTNPAVAAASNGIGRTIQGLNTGSGEAGHFEIAGTSNPSRALVVKTAGGGSAGLFEITKPSNPAPALQGYTSGTGAGVDGHTSGDGLGVRAVSDGAGDALSGENFGTGRAGHLQIVSPSNGADGLLVETNGNGIAGEFRIAKATNTNAAVHAETAGTGAALEGKQTAATGIGVRGVTTQGGTAVAGEAQGNGVGVFGQAAGGGAAVFARNTSSATGTALQIDQGTIKVTGAGVETHTAVFIHCVTQNNFSTWDTFIDNPMTNGDPSAILIVTTNAYVPGVPHVDLGYRQSAIGADFDGYYWHLFSTGHDDLVVNACFNVMVIKK